MLYTTTQKHEELRKIIRNFAENEIKPQAFLLDQNNEFPAEAVKKLGEMGYMGIPYPEEYGGAGLDALSYAIAVEELSRVDGGAGVILSAHVSLGSWPIFAFGTEAQKQKYLVPLAKGEKIGAFGLTEPNAGSDAGGTETTAVLKGDYYLLNGGKIFITNAPKADTYVVFAARFEITIHEGRNRQIRRMCALAGMRVRRLKRIREGALELGSLPCGKWRMLTEEEIRIF